MCGVGFMCGSVTLRLTFGNASWRIEGPHPRNRNIILGLTAEEGLPPLTKAFKIPNLAPDSIVKYSHCGDLQFP